MYVRVTKADSHISVKLTLCLLFHSDQTQTALIVCYKTTICNLGTRIISMFCWIFHQKFTQPEGQNVIQNFSVLELNCSDVRQMSDVKQMSIKRDKTCWNIRRAAPLSQTLTVSSFTTLNS